MSGQLALVFHVLANAALVPSTNPLITLKSSVIMLLKFPHKPFRIHMTQQESTISVLTYVMHIRRMQRRKGKAR